MKKAVIYYRVSTTEQNCDRQKHDLVPFVKAMGYKLVRTYEEKKSATEDMKTREQLTEMRKLTKEDVDTIFIWDITRLSRRSIDFINLVHEFSEKGINIWFYDKSLQTLDSNGKINAITEMYMYILGLFAQMDAENLRAKYDSGKEAALAKGYAYTYNIPLGYKIVGKKLVIDESISPFVKEAFELYISGKSIRYIADWFNINKVPLKRYADSKVWVKSSVEKILKNTVYYGKGKRKKLINKGTGEQLVRYFDVPAIIDKALWDKAQAQFLLNKTVTDKTRKRNNLLRGLLKCGVCKNNYILATSKSLPMYRCCDQYKDINQKEGCTNGGILLTTADSVIWEAIRNNYEQDLYLEKYNKQKTLYLENYNANLQKIKNIDEDINKLEKELERAQRAYVKGLFSELDLEKQTKQTRNDVNRMFSLKTEIEAQNALLYDRANVQLSLDNDYIRSDSLSYSEKKEVCRKLIDNIYIYCYGTFYRLLRVILKAGVTLNILLNNKSKKYCVIDDATVSFNTPLSVPAFVKEQMKDFTVISNNNELFGEEIFGEYSYKEIWEIMDRYGYIKILPKPNMDEIFTVIT